MMPDFFPQDLLAVSSILRGQFTTASGLLSQTGSNASFSVLLTAILRGRFTTASGLHVCYCVDGDSTASCLHEGVLDHTH